MIRAWRHGGQVASPPPVPAQGPLPVRSWPAMNARTGRRPDPRRRSPSAQIEVRSDDNTHFEAALIAAAFEGQRPLARHQLVYRALGERVGREIHALSIEAFTPAEVGRPGTAPESASHGQAQITGGMPLEGEVRISGAKNATLPILAGACWPTGR